MSLTCLILLLQLLFGVHYHSGGSASYSNSRAYLESPIIFSPDGRILQLDAASAAVERGSLVLAVTTKSCQEVILLFAKKMDDISKLQVSSRNQLYHLHESRKGFELLLCATGWVPDAGNVQNLVDSFFCIVLT